MIRAAALATVALALLTNGCATIPRTESVYFIEGVRTEPIVIVTTPAPEAKPRDAAAEAKPVHTAMVDNDATPWD